MKYIGSFILYVLAVILFVPFSFLNTLVVIIKGVNKRSFLNTMDQYFKNEALSIDIFANSSLKTLWNTTLRKRGGEPFGLIHDETISSVLGKNQRDNTLSFLGKILCFILDTIEKDHCKTSIDSHLERRKNNKKYV